MDDVFEFGVGGGWGSGCSRLVLRRYLYLYLGQSSGDWTCFWLIRLLCFTRRDHLLRQPLLHHHPNHLINLLRQFPPHQLSRSRLRFIRRQLFYNLFVSKTDPDSAGMKVRKQLRGNAAGYLSLFFWSKGGEDAADGFCHVRVAMIVTPVSAAMKDSFGFDPVAEGLKELKLDRSGFSSFSDMRWLRCRDSASNRWWSRDNGGSLSSRRRDNRGSASPSSQDRPLSQCYLHPVESVHPLMGL